MAQPTAPASLTSTVWMRGFGRSAVGQQLRLVDLHRQHRHKGCGQRGRNRGHIAPAARRPGPTIRRRSKGPRRARHRLGNHRRGRRQIAARREAPAAPAARCHDRCAALMFSHTIGRGSTDPTIWFSAPRRILPGLRTIAVNSLSTAIMVSTCTRSSASRVPSAYSAASAIWSSL